MPIRYKVVKRRSRCSAVINGNSKYALRYLPGSIVTARKETLGVMTFKNKIAAVNWMDIINYNQYQTWESQLNLIVIRVETIGRGKAPRWIANDVTAEDLDNFYSPESEYQSMLAIDNTLCYPAVKVLE